MTGTTLSSDALPARRARLLFRAWRRGTREMDLLVGRYADSALPTLSEADLEAFERLIEVPDADLFGWVTGSLAVPENYDTSVFRALQSFSVSDQSDGS